MKITLLGYGKMGKEIEKAALEKGHEIFLKIDSEKDWQTYENVFAQSEIAIDFSMPDTAVANIKKCFKSNIPVVEGTTAWYNQLDEIKSLCKQKNQALFFASNYSIGVNIFFEINKQLASIMNNYDSYEPSIEESHHIQKLDAPSGTAITLANEIIEKIERKKKWIKEFSQAPNELAIKSIRKGNIPGTHSIFYDSPTDVLEIKHTAKNRKGFAFGAVLAAEFLLGKTGFFTMEDLLF